MVFLVVFNFWLVCSCSVGVVAGGLGTCWPAVGGALGRRAAYSSQILLSCAKDAAEVSFGALGRGMIAIPRSTPTVARLHRLAARCEDEAVSNCRGHSGRRARIDGVERDLKTQHHLKRQWFCDCGSERRPTCAAVRAVGNERRRRLLPPDTHETEPRAASQRAVGSHTRARAASGDGRGIFLARRQGQNRPTQRTPRRSRAPGPPPRTSSCCARSRATARASGPSSRRTCRAARASSAGSGGTTS